MSRSLLVSSRYSSANLPSGPYAALVVQQLHGSQAGLSSALEENVCPLSFETMAKSLSERKQAVTAPRPFAASEKPSLGLRLRLRTGENAFAPGSRVA